MSELENLKTMFESMKGKTGKPLSPYTVDNYVTRINRLSMIVTDKPYNGDTSWLLDYDTVHKRLLDSTLTSKKDYLTGASRLLQHIGADISVISNYKAGMSEFKEDEAAIRHQNMASDSIISKSIPLCDILHSIDTYDLGPPSHRDYMSKVMYKTICTFYFKNTLVPRNDLAEMKLASIGKHETLPPDFNYVISIPGEPYSLIQMNKYKTSETYGSQTFKNTKDMIDMLTLYCSVYNKKSGDMLFSSGSIPYTTKYFSTIVQHATEAVLGSRISVNLIRSIIISDYYKTTHSINDDTYLSHRFLHSTSIGKEYMKLNLS